MQKAVSDYPFQIEGRYVVVLFGRRPNGFLGLSLNDRTILVQVIRQSLLYDARLKALKGKLLTECSSSKTSFYE